MIKAQDETMKTLTMKKTQGFMTRTLSVSEMDKDKQHFIKKNYPGDSALAQEVRMMFDTL